MHVRLRSPRLHRDAAFVPLAAYAQSCGTNCQYPLVDGRTHRALGTVGGSVVVVRAQVINGYPVIQVYGHGSAEARHWSTLVCDGAAYVAVGTVYLEGLSQARLFETLRHVPY